MKTEGFLDHVPPVPQQDRTTKRRTLLISTTHEHSAQRQEQSMETRNFKKGGCDRFASLWLPWWRFRSRTARVSAQARSCRPQQTNIERGAIGGGGATRLATGVCFFVFSRYANATG